MRNGLAAVTAQIAAANRPKITADKQSLDLGSAVENYFRAQNLRDQRQKSDLLSSAGNSLAQGDEQGFMADLAKADPVAAYNLQQDGKYKDLAYALRDKEIAARKAELENNQNFQREMAEMKNKNDLAKAMFAAEMQNRGYSQKLEYDRNKEEQKQMFAQQEAARQNAAMQPRLEQSITRAENALNDGTGLGQLGGWGWTTGTGGQNRADIKNAQSQINTAMRGLLKEMGVGSTELNSAAEAEAYRYQIDPSMPINQQLRVLKNFRDDYMNGTLKSDLAASYGKGPTDENLYTKYNLQRGR